LVVFTADPNRGFTRQGDRSAKRERQQARAKQHETPAAVAARNPPDTKSWLRERAILQTTLPVTGETLSNYFPDFGATHWPPMKLS
jgi:hypothetical protein